jgi:enoyl-CoA hydratase/carnithine racemase
MPSVQIGLFGCASMMRSAAPRVASALKMLLAGGPDHTRSATGWGLFNRFVEPAELAESTHTLGRQIAGASRLTERTGKRPPTITSTSTLSFPDAHLAPRHREFPKCAEPSTCLSTRRPITIGTLRRSFLAPPPSPL